MPKRSPYAPDRVRIREALRRLREAQGLRQVDLASRLERPQSFVSKYERGERQLDVLELREVCDALGTSISALLAEVNLVQATAAPPSPGPADDQVTPPSHVLCPLRVTLRRIRTEDFLDAFCARHEQALALHASRTDTLTIGSGLRGRLLEELAALAPEDPERLLLEVLLIGGGQPSAVSPALLPLQLDRLARWLASLPPGRRRRGRARLHGRRPPETPQALVDFLARTAQLGAVLVSRLELEGPGSPEDS